MREERTAGADQFSGEANPAPVVVADAQPGAADEEDLEGGARIEMAEDVAWR